MNKILFKLTITCGFLLACVTGLRSQSLSINTLAGQTAQGSADGFGSNGRFRHPNSLAADSTGVIYVADTENSTIRKITTNRVVSTFAGFAGSIGSLNGTGTNAQFYGPQGITLDAAGFLYVADTANATIRKITTNGVVTTLAGSAGNINSFDGAGTNAQFFQPQGIAVDSTGNVYVADSWNHTIRKITPAGVVSTLAGLAGNLGSVNGTNSKARFNRPAGVAVDSSNNVFVTDFLNHTIRKITPTGTVSTIAGLPGVWGSADGTNNAARFFQPQGILADNVGNLFVVDSGNQTIRKISASGTNWIVSTVAGSLGNAGYVDGTGSAAQFYFPAGLARDGAGYFYFADSGNNTIRTERTFVNYFLNTSIYPLNSGTIALSPDQPVYDPGQAVSLTATATPGFTFVGWSGDIVTTNNPINVTMTQSKTFVANFISAADIIIDNPEASYSGVWTIGTSSVDKYGSYYQYTSTITGNIGIAVATYTPNIITAGQYDVSIWYPQGSNRSVRAPVLVAFDGGSFTTNVNQTTGGGGWRLIASHKNFTQGTNGFVDIKNNTGETNKVVMADAVRFTYLPGPIIYSQPQNQRVGLSSSATFNVLAGGSGQLTYQWQFNEVNIPGATNSSFTKTNVQNGDVGGYAVVISNQVATVLSDVAALSLLPSHQLGSFYVLPDGRFHFTFSGDNDVNYAIEASTTFTNWTVITNLSSPDGMLEFIDPLPSLEKRFYRARSSP
jgi:uncharacterized repeat protein (TIGR02543 family)